ATPARRLITIGNWGWYAVGAQAAAVLHASAGRRRAGGAAPDGLFCDRGWLAAGHVARGISCAILWGFGGRPCCGCWRGVPAPVRVRQQPGPGTASPAPSRGW